MSHVRESKLISEWWVDNIKIAYIQMQELDAYSAHAFLLRPLECKCFHCIPIHPKAHR